MTTYTPSPKFQDAANYLSSAPSLAKVSNTIKLELYGLFKYLTVSPNPNTSRPSLFDITGRAKWDAWSSAGNIFGDSSLEAETRYLELARELGWQEGATSTQQDTAGVPSTSNESDDDIWDKDSESGAQKKGGGGMGTSVSTVTVEGDEQRKQGTIHSFAVSGKAEEFEEYLQAHPTADLNELDEYGYTPLHLACDRGHLDVVKLLLKRGVDQNIKDQDEFTALELARIAEHEDIVQLLQSTTS